MRNSALFAATALAMPAIIHSSAYANTLTGLVPDLYAALDTVSRELTGFLPAVSRAPGAERAAVGQNVVYNVSPEMAAYDVVPAMNVPEPPDLTMGNGFMAITKSRAVPFGFTGEEQRALNTGGPGGGYMSVQAGLFAQALRTLVNEIETDLAVAAAAGASRAYGTAGTTPFGADKMIDSAQVRKILDDNGAPLFGRSLVVNTAAGANLRSMYNLTRANEAGTALTLRQGELLDLHGFSVKESAKVPVHDSGTATTATTNAAGYAVGARTITLAAVAGAGSINTGDVVSFAGDTNKYVVTAGDASAADGGTITIAAPGLRVAIPAAATGITLAADYTANVAFSADAIHAVMRPPAAPVEGDLALDRMLVTDVRSGVVFEVSIWPGYRKVRGEVALAWGSKVVKPEHVALLLG